MGRDRTVRQCYMDKEVNGTYPEDPLELHDLAILLNPPGLHLSVRRALKLLHVAKDEARLLRPWESTQRREQRFDKTSSTFEDAIEDDPCEASEEDVQHGHERHSKRLMVLVGRTAVSFYELDIQA